MDMIAAVVGLHVAMLTLLAVVIGLLYPVFWIWMLIDSIVRDISAYPAGGANEKLAWVLLVALVQPVAFIYWLFVYRKGSAVRAETPVVAAQA